MPLKPVKKSRSTFNSGLSGMDYYDMVTIGILEIIFVHHVARSFCETIKLPQEMPKVQTSSFSLGK
jgi:hypothetical protein